MSKALSRNSRGSDHDSRAARRSGKGAGDWLDDEIRDEQRARRDDDDRDELDAEDRLEVATRRLARASEERSAAKPRRWRDEAREEARFRDRFSRRRAPARDDDEDDVERVPDTPRQKPIDAKAIVDDAAALFEERLAASERHTANALNNLASLIKRGQRDRNEGESESVKRAIEAFAEHAEKSERKTARALNDIAGILENGQRERVDAEGGIAVLTERLARIESRLSEQPGAGATVRPLRSALARLETRLDRLSSEDRTADFENALSGLDQRLAEIARRLDDDTRRREERDFNAQREAERAQQERAQQEREQKEREQTERENVERARLAAAPSSSVITPAPERDAQPASPSTRRPLVDAIAEITQRQRALEEAHAAQQALQAQQANSQQRLDSLKGVIDNIAEKLDGVREDATERADQQLVTMRQIESLRREVQDVAHTVGQLAPRASISAIEDALRDLAFRVEIQRDRGVADDVLAPAERIAGELRNAIRELDPSPIVRNLHEDVLTIGRRLDAMQAELQNSGGGADGAALRAVALHTQDMKEQLAALASRPLPLEKIETRLYALTQRVDALSLSVGDSGADVAEVVKGISSIIASETARGFETFNRRLEQVSNKFDEAVARLGARKFDELGARIEEVGKSLAQRIDRSVAKPVDAELLAGKINEAVSRNGAKKIDELGARIEEVGKSLAQRIDRAAPKGADTSALEQLVAKLAKKIDSAIDGKPHTAGFEEIGRKIDRLETRIGETAPAESFARIEALLARPAVDKQFAELAQRIDLIHRSLTARVEHGAGPSEPADVRYIEELVRGLDQKIEAAIHSDGRKPDLQGIERQLGQLSSKIDRLEDPANARLGALAAPGHDPRLDLIADRLERMQAALADRANESARVEARQSDLANLVEGLAQRVNQALDPAADSGALKSLESQIGALTRRLDRSRPNSEALVGIESRINDLLARIEDTRHATTQAAEEAVRRATQEILREASVAAPGALLGEVEREISDIRKSQDESGQRTHETLLAVHETLERVVDRLAMFEDELTEIRTTPAPPPRVASAPAARAPAAPVATPPRRDPEPKAPPREIRLDTAGDDDLMDFLLPPGGGVGARREPSLDTAAEDLRAPDKRSVQTDFIAAARRAAQQAAADAEAAELEKETRRGARATLSGAASALRAAATPDAAKSTKSAAKSAAKSSAKSAAADGAKGGVGAVLEERRKPLLLALAGVVLLVGAYSISKVMNDGAAPIEPATQEQNETAPEGDEPEAKAPVRNVTPPAAEAVAPAAPAAKEPAAQEPAAKAPAPVPLPRFIPQPKPPKSTEAAPADQTVTGSLGAAPLASVNDAIGPIKTLAAKGDATAQFEYGARLTEGRGVTRDPKAAAEWFEKSAAQGLAPAQYRLGSMYEKGVGVDRSYASARKWYQAAAEAGNARAMHNLAVLLAEGGDGKPDYGAASQWFQKAAEYGVRDSQFNLAILYARGLGVAQNLPQSYLWFSAAAEQGDEDAGKKRDEVAARLDTKELAAAKALASGFKAKSPPREANDVLPPPGGWEAMQAAPPAAKSGSKSKVSQI